MKIKILPVAMTLLITLIGAAMNARADTFDWSFTGTMIPLNGSGTLTDDTFGNISGITGTFDGLNITQSTVPTGEVFPGQNPLLNSTGITFATTNGPFTQDWTLSFTNTVYVGVETSGGSQADYGTFTLNPVPEPSTYALFGLGLLALGIASCRRRID